MKHIESLGQGELKGGQSPEKSIDRGRCCLGAMRNVSDNKKAGFDRTKKFEIMLKTELSYFYMITQQRRWYLFQLCLLN